MKVFLIVVAMTAGNGALRHAAEFPSFDACYTALKAVKFKVADGGDSEGVVVAFCSTEDTTR